MILTGRPKRAILIPVKPFACAKTRLAPHLLAPERRTLAAAMCADLFAAVAGLPAVERVFVVSAESQALAWARERGWVALAEQRPTSERASVNAATRHCVAQGVEALLRLPIDVPLADANDFAAVFAAAAPAPAAVLVPSRDGTGTNALLRSPPDLFATHFGPNSLAIHREVALRCHAEVRILRRPRLEWDVDEWRDLDGLEARARPGSAVAAWLRRHWPAARARALTGAPAPAASL